MSNNEYMKIDNTYTELRPTQGVADVGISDKVKISDESIVSKKEGHTKEKNEKKQLKNAVEQANKKLLSINKEMRLSIHEGTKKINIKIIDKETDEVIKEYPPEQLLDMFAKMIELSGLIIDERR